MSDCKQLTKEEREYIEPILNKIGLTLATFMQASNVPNGIQYGLMIGDKAYLLNFMREPRLDGIKDTDSSNLADVNAIGTEEKHS